MDRLQEVAGASTRIGWFFRKKLWKVLTKCCVYVFQAQGDVKEQSTQYSHAVWNTFQTEKTEVMTLMISSLLHHCSSPLSRVSQHLCVVLLLVLRLVYGQKNACTCVMVLLIMVEEWWRRREELLNEAIFVFFAHKEYSRCVRLNHCCHMEYVSVSGNISFACRLRNLSDFIKNILICVPKMNEGLTSLEWTNQLNWKTPSPWSLGIHWLWSWHIIIIFFLTVLFGAAFYICI